MIEGYQQFYFQYQIQPQLEFLRSICSQRAKIDRIEDLSDGLILYQIIKPLKLSNDQNKISFHQDPSCFLHRLQNFKYLLRLIQRYWSERLKQQLTQQKQVDILRISKDKNSQQIKKFVKIIVKTLFHSQQRESFIQKMLQMSQKTQQYFMKIVQQSLGQKKNSISIVNQNSNEHSLYEKIIELQQQNQRILKILNQVYQQKQQWKMKQKQTQQKLQQKQKQLKKLTWQITLFNCQKKQNLDKISLNYFQEKKINQKLKNQIKEYQAKQKHYLNELQNQKEIIQTLNDKIKELKILEQEIKQQNQQNLTLKIENQNLIIKLNQYEQTNTLLKDQVKSLQQIINSNSNKLDQFQMEIQRLNSLLKTKQQKIYHLQQNIHFLTSQQTASQKDHKEKSQPKSSIKSQCQQIINEYQQKGSHFYLNKYKRQIFNLKSQIQKNKQEKVLSKQIIQSQSQEIIKLKLYEQENKKLVQMISHMNKYRGQENQVLVKCIYKLRMKLLGKQLKKQNILQNSRAYGTLNKSCQILSEKKQIKNTPQNKRLKQPLRQISNQNKYSIISK